MTIETTTPYSHDPRWEAALTRSDAWNVGIDRHDYDRALTVARQTAAEHTSTGTPRHLWEPTPVQNALITEPFVLEGELVLAAGLAGEVDLVLDEVQGDLDEVEAVLQELREPSEPITAAASGRSCSRADAVQVVDALDLRIGYDEAAGRHHHRRAKPVLLVIGRVAPWVEALGFLAFVTYYLNVPLLQPWLDWLGWTLAFTIVTFSILGQTWLVHHAATEHNHRREAYADGQRHEGEAAHHRRHRYLVGAGVVALGITCGMIWRGLAALGDTGVGTTVVMVFLATVTGLLMPLLAFLGTALDGSSVSRERDDLAAALGANLADHSATVDVARRTLLGVGEVRTTLLLKTFPGLCERVQQEVDAVYRIHGIVRLLVGGLSADPMQPVPLTIDQDGSQGGIETSLRGARAVSIGPLLSRLGRLRHLDERRTQLLTALESLPKHPRARR